MWVDRMAHRRSLPFASAGMTNRRGPLQGEDSYQGESRIPPLRSHGTLGQA